mmetsp:Transcript_27327/g.87827  ORF Transcript_27327/g.87827 Transcript_27327/m.87827 type:complete len:225 (+) Transcript_27327:486-1160(+)
MQHTGNRSCRQPPPFTGKPLQHLDHTVNRMLIRFDHQHARVESAQVKPEPEVAKHLARTEDVIWRHQIRATGTIVEAIDVGEGHHPARRLQCFAQEEAQLARQFLVVQRPRGISRHWAHNAGVSEQLGHLDVLLRLARIRGTSAPLPLHLCCVLLAHGNQQARFLHQRRQIGKRFIRQLRRVPLLLLLATHQARNPSMGSREPSRRLDSRLGQSLPRPAGQCSV